MGKRWFMSFFCVVCLGFATQSKAASTIDNSVVSDKDPDCTCTDGWASNMAFSTLKNAGIVKYIDRGKTKITRLASEKIGEDLYRQVHDIFFTKDTGEIIEVITINDASHEECSMSDVDVFVVSKHLGPNDLITVKDMTYYLDPEKVMNEITNRSAQEVVSELYSHSIAWEYVLKKIASGNDYWLKVAAALYPVSDTRASKVLSLAVGEALGNAPENVFKIALKEFQLESVCSSPDVYDYRYGLYPFAIKAIDLRQTKVESITDTKLSEQKNKCIQALEKSKKDMKIFFGVKD